MEKNGLEILFKEVETKDAKTGRPYKFQKHYVQVNGTDIQVKAKGPTAYEVFKKLVEDGAKLVLMHERLQTELQDGTIKEYDSLYIQVGDEHLPMQAVDSYGKTLVIKALTKI